MLYTYLNGQICCIKNFIPKIKALTQERKKARKKKKKERKKKNDKLKQNETNK